MYLLMHILMVLVTMVERVLEVFSVIVSNFNIGIVISVLYSS